LSPLRTHLLRELCCMVWKNSCWTVLARAETARWCQLRLMLEGKSAALLYRVRVTGNVKDLSLLCTHSVPRWNAQVFSPYCRNVGTLITYIEISQQWPMSSFVSLPQCACCVELCHAKRALLAKPCVLIEISTTKSFRPVHRTAAARLDMLHFVLKRAMHSQRASVCCRQACAATNNHGSKGFAAQHAMPALMWRHGIHAFLTHCGTD